MRAIAILSVVIFLLTNAALAGGITEDIDDLILARAGEGTVRALLAETLPIAVGQLDEFGSDAALVYTQRAYSTELTSYRFVYNVVWWVKEGQVQDLTTFVREFAPDIEIEQAWAFVIRPGEFSIDAALAAPVEHLSRERITLRRGSGQDMFTSLIVAFESAEPGDLLGVSIAGREARPLWWMTWFLGDERPVGRADLRLICSPESVYILFGQGFAPGQLEKDVVRDDRGQASDVAMRVERVAPYRDEPYGLPWREQSPSLRVVWRAAQWSPDGRHVVWFRYDHWNQIAVEMAATERAYLRKSGKVEKLARRMTNGLDAAAAADSVYLFVRDALQNVDVGAYRKSADSPTVEDVLELRTGLDFEKAYLLLAMLRGLDIPAEIIWAHSPDDGAMFDKYPSWGQVEVPMVKVRIGDSERWYDLNCASCVPGSFSPVRRGGVAVAYNRDADRFEDDVMDQLIADAWGRSLDFFDLYIRRIAGEPWHVMTKLPGSADAGAGSYRERVAWDGRTGGTADFRVTGFMPAREELIGAELPEEALSSWFSRRYAAASPDSILGLVGAAGDTVRGRLAFTAALPAATGDTWVIPANILMGKPHVGAWRDDRTSAFHIGQAREFVWEVSVPLPEGWTDVRVPAPCRHGSRSLNYEASFRTADGRLILHRRLVEKPVTVRSQQDLDFIGREIRMINEFETTPVVVQNRADGS